MEAAKKDSTLLVKIAIDARNIFFTANKFSSYAKGNQIKTNNA